MVQGIIRQGRRIAPPPRRCLAALSPFVTPRPAPLMVRKRDAILRAKNANPKFVFVCTYTQGRETGRVRERERERGGGGRERAHLLAQHVSPFACTS